jgi:phage terminase large subunit-like protein
MHSTEVFNRYVDGVLDGSIVACRNVRLACLRHCKDLLRTDGLYYFDETIAEQSVEFIHAVATHVMGEWASGQAGH